MNPIKIIKQITLKYILHFLIFAVLLASFSNSIQAQVIDVLIKGLDDGIRESRQLDYSQAVLNAKLQAIERAGVNITSFTKVENFQTKYHLVETKAEAVILPGFQIMDMGYQEDGSYLVILSGKVKYEDTVKDAKLTVVMNRYKDMRRPGDSISFDVVEDGGGITQYIWKIYPYESIEKSKEWFLDDDDGFIKPGHTLIISEYGHVFSALDDSNMEKAKNALKENKSLYLGTGRPMSNTITIPPGRYFIDYEIILRKETMGTKSWSPIEFNYQNNANNWGPYEFNLDPGEFKTIVCTPNGNNLSPNVMHSALNEFLAFLIYNQRNKRF